MIASVESIGEGKIIITFDNGEWIIRPDDGSLVDYMGESNVNV